MNVQSQGARLLSWCLFWRRSAEDWFSCLFWGCVRAWVKFNLCAQNIDFFSSVCLPIRRNTFSSRMVLYLGNCSEINKLTSNGTEMLSSVRPQFKSESFWVSCNLCLSFVEFRLTLGQSSRWVSDALWDQARIQSLDERSHPFLGILENWNIREGMLSFLNKWQPL